MDSAAGRAIVIGAMRTTIAALVTLSLAACMEEPRRLHDAGHDASDPVTPECRSLSENPTCSGACTGPWAACPFGYTPSCGGHWTWDDYRGWCILTRSVVSCSEIGAEPECGDFRPTCVPDTAVRGPDGREHYCYNGIDNF